MFKSLRGCTIHDPNITNVLKVKEISGEETQGKPTLIGKPITTNPHVAKTKVRSLYFDIQSDLSNHMLYKVQNLYVSPKDIHR